MSRYIAASSRGLIVDTSNLYFLSKKLKSLSFPRFYLRSIEFTEFFNVLGS